MVAPAFSYTRLMTIGLLPPTIRAEYGFSWSARRDRVLRRSTTFIRKLLPLTPSVLRHWPAARAAERAARGSGCPFHPLAGGHF